MPGLATFRLSGPAAAVALFIAAALTVLPGGASAQVTAFKQAVAEAAARDNALATFYKADGFSPVWTGKGSLQKRRREALLQALDGAPMQGLPASRFDPQRLMGLLRAAKTPADRGRLDVEMSRVFLDYARSVQSGLLTPSKVDSGLVLQVPRRDPVKNLSSFVKSNPRAFLRSLPPSSAEYGHLMRIKNTLERKLGEGGWGPTVPAGTLRPGESGNAVVALRNRLTAMGYLDRSSAADYDAALQRAVQLFQLDHGLKTDGVAGPGTIAEINKGIPERLKSVLVAMERERWLNKPLGKRHVYVNLAAFTMQLVDDGHVTFETRAVVGKDTADRRSPEFSDMMEYIVINPSWYVPRSIAVKEYLPLLRKNRYAVKHLDVTNSSGRVVNRANVDFSQYNASNFPFNMRQPPSRGNALGRVKFIFPNRWNIYLHDTPSKGLFSRQKRDFSHGCIRLADPFDFAYALLARQVSDPKAFFQSKLATGSETRVALQQPVPVHLTYRTAFTSAKGRVNYRDDVYGRDGRIWRALSNAGVALRALQG